METKNKTESKNDQSAPSEASERGCTAAKIRATGTGTDFAYSEKAAATVKVIVLTTRPWLWSLRSSETTTRSRS